MAKSNEFNSMTVEDLIADDAFLQWVKRPDAAQDRYWQAVLNEKPELVSVVEEAKRLINGLRFVEEKAPAARKQLVFDRIKAEIAPDEEEPPVPVVKTMSIRRLLVAASLLMVASVGIWLYTRYSGKPSNLLEDARQLHAFTEGGMLYLSDGRAIALEETGAATDKDGVMQLVLTADNRFSATGTATTVDSVVSPTGKLFRMVLSDGSKVWMNSRSTLRITGQYNAGHRGVNLTGQGYFEVTPDADRPFFAEFDHHRVEVLGTRFDVSSYPGTTPVVTLASGSVQVGNRTGEAVYLKPGQQAIFETPDGQPVVTTADVKQATAWKDGMFAFQDEHITSVMDQLARWYGVEVVYDGTLPALPISGSIPSDIALEEVLSILQGTGVDASFTVKDHTLTVRKKN